MWDDEEPSIAVIGRPRSGSEVVIIDEEEPPAINPFPPGRLHTIDNLNLTNCPRAHVGDNHVTVTNISHSDEVVKGGFLCLELISPANNRRLRCSVAVFSCWALVVAFGLAILFICSAFSMKYRIDIGLKEEWYLRREEWLAEAPSSTYKIEFLRLPVKIAMIGHSVTWNCTDKYDCKTRVISIQRDHIERYGDIGPNFLVGGDDGLVFEGAGANVVGSATAGDNTKQISIMFIGDYTTDFPNPTQFDHVANLLEVLVEERILDENYVLYGYCQLRTWTISPGPHIMSKLPQFPHWDDENATTCLRGES